MALKSSSSDINGAQLNIFGKGTVVVGDVTTQSSIRIDGSIKGKVICKHTLTIGPGGSIEGEVEAENAIIGGKVKGKLFVKQKLVLESTSSMTGELRAAKLIVDEGAVFDGMSSMGKPAQESLVEKKS